MFGALADRYGPSRVIAMGGVMIAAGLALTPFVTSAWALIFSLGLLRAIGAGAGSLTILIGAASRTLKNDFGAAHAVMPPSLNMSVIGCSGDG